MTPDKLDHMARTSHKGFIQKINDKDDSDFEGQSIPYLICTIYKYI